MSKKVLIAVFAATLVAGCNDEEEAACTLEELQSKSAKITEGFQSNPALAQEFMSTLQDLAPKFQEANAAGETNDELISELCVAYDDLIEKM